MAERIRVHVTLDFEVTNEMELREAGYRAYRDRWAPAMAASEGELDPAIVALADAYWGTPQAAIVTLLSGMDGPLNGIEIPGASQRGNTIGNPEIVESTP